MITKYKVKFYTLQRQRFTVNKKEENNWKYVSFEIKTKSSDSYINMHAVKPLCLNWRKRDLNIIFYFSSHLKTLQNIKCGKYMRKLLSMM